MTITLYDIPSVTPENAWSPNTWKTRFTLNFKRIPYRTEWIEYPEIEPLSIKLGIEPSSKKADGTPQYTLPAIHDSTTGIYVSDSLRIAEYLDKTYPETPTLFPYNTVGFQIAFAEVFASKVSAVWSSIVAATYFKLNPRSREYFRHTREAMTGKKIEELAPNGDEAVKQWALFEKGLGEVDAWYAKNEGKGSYLLGNTISWGDIVIASYLMRYKVIWGEDSREWKNLSSWHGGRWRNMLENLKEYQNVI